MIYFYVKHIYFIFKIIFLASCDLFRYLLIINVSQFRATNWILYFLLLKNKLLPEIYLEINLIYLVFY